MVDTKRRSRAAARPLEPIVLTIDDVLALVHGIGARRLAEVTASGELPSFRMGRRRVYHRSDVEKWVADQRGA
jgi:hypothetical protein